MSKLKKTTSPAPRKPFNEYILAKIKYQESKISYHQKRIEFLKKQLK